MTLDLIAMCLEVRVDEDLEALQKVLHTALGLESMIAGRVCASTKVEEAHFFGIDEEWGQLYISNNYSSVDPVFHYAMTSTAPITWSDAYARSRSPQHEFVRRSRDFGLQEGICYANRGYAATVDTTVVSLGSGTFALSPVQTAVADRVIPHVAEILVRPSLWHYPRLTAREQEIIKWCADGKSYWEISLILSISVRTVKFHMNNIFKKLNVSNKAQAVARSLKLGHI